MLSGVQPSRKALGRGEVQVREGEEDGLPAKRRRGQGQSQGRGVNGVALDQFRKRPPGDRSRAADGVTEFGYIASPYLVKRNSQGITTRRKSAAKFQPLLSPLLYSSSGQNKIG